MKTKRISLIILTLIITTGIVFCAESSMNENRSAIGIRLDSTPLPQLLVKHLGLKQGQGIRISNVMKNSAADEAGLERDDIVIRFQGKDITDPAAFTYEVREVGIGKEVPLDIIHLGQRKTVTLKLKAVITNPEWKYPDVPLLDQSFRPGGIFLLDPKTQDWTQVFEDQLPDDVKSDIYSNFKELYTSMYNINGKQYTVTIEGSPKDNDSSITVKIDNNEFKTTIGELDELPEDYQEAAKNAIENAKQKETNRIPMIFDDTGSNLTPRLLPDSPLLNTPDPYDSSLFQRMEEQMKQMQEQFKELEKSHQKLLKHLNQNKT